MRSLYPLLLIVIFIFAAVMIFTSEANEKPEDEATAFLGLVSHNDAEAALREFGDNTCHCAPKGGYAAYLHGYEAAQEPNITFLLGKEMVLGKPRVKPLPSHGTPYIMPWDKTEDSVVYVPVSFPDEATRPYFLPIDSAFGFQISEKQLQSFSSDPGDWMKALTLRMRSSLKPGTVKPKDPKQPETELEKAAKDGLLPADLAKYIHPADAGMVKMNSGQIVPLASLEQELPRLKSCEVGMKVVRRGTFKRWTVKKIGLVNCVIVSHNKEFKIATNDRQTETEEPQSAVGKK
jgi:hypothetical protein